MQDAFKNGAEGGRAEVATALAGTPEIKFYRPFQYSTFFMFSSAVVGAGAVTGICFPFLIKKTI